MFNMGADPKVRGVGHIVLNLFRAFNLIGLAAMAIASWVMIIFAGMNGRFFFFDALAHFWVFVVCVFLSIAECSLFKDYFKNNWPVLSHGHSFAWLGLALIMLGTQVLSNLDKDIDSAKKLGRPMWRLVMASGILAIIFGFFNLIASLIFRDGKAGINARQIRRDGKLAKAEAVKDYFPAYVESQRATTPQPEEKVSSAFKRMTHLFKSKKAKVSSPDAAVPQPDVEHAYYGEAVTAHGGEDRSSPIMPHIQRPPSAMHPARLRRVSDSSESKYSYSDANMSMF